MIFISERGSTLESYYHLSAASRQILEKQNIILKKNFKTCIFLLREVNMQYQLMKHPNTSFAFETHKYHLHSLTTFKPQKKSVLTALKSSSFSTNCSMLLESEFVILYHILCILPKSRSQIFASNFHKFPLSRSPLHSRLTLIDKQIPQKPHQVIPKLLVPKYKLLTVIPMYQEMYLIPKAKYFSCFCLCSCFLLNERCVRNLKTLNAYFLGQHP